MTIEALICDVDGTLADTEECHREAFNRAFHVHGLDWTWTRPQYRRLLAIAGGKERLAAFIRALPLGDRAVHRLLERVPEVHAEKTRQYGAMVAGGQVRLREGVARLLHEALDAGCRLAIASTTTAANIDALLTANLGPRGLDLFTVIACGDQVREKKPAPDIYQLALDTLQLPPDRAIAFEDSGHGLRAATRAGLWTLVTPTYWTSDDDFADAGLVLPGLGEPGRPLAAAPARALARPWLAFDELARLAEPGPAPGPLARLYGLPEGRSARLPTT